MARADRGSGDCATLNPPEVREAVPVRRINSRVNGVLPQCGLPRNVRFQDPSVGVGRAGAADVNTTTIVGHLLLSSVGAIVSAKGSMRWLFTRENETIEFTAQGDGANHFTTAIRWPNGGQEIRRFFTVEPMLLHLLALTRQLRNSDFTFKGASLDDREQD
jgi:hypothetical protein